MILPFVNRVFPGHSDFIPNTLGLSHLMLSQIFCLVGLRLFFASIPGHFIFGVSFSLFMFLF